ncbi:hypothetical protein [Undibacterium terreum]|uniref:PsiF repeat-containing protein n=1 Tax=Undibacterium terreum TaxID=1224302 RepID=A0A916XDV2_9BURK|nr:hypothetical protein [Undibacterium terreum]GGC64513.1 hypothetical protein GCM10011396_09370 [Undibacterium terreum]
MFNAKSLALALLLSGTSVLAFAQASSAPASAPAASASASSTPKTNTVKGRKHFLSKNQKQCASPDLSDELRKKYRCDAPKETSNVSTAKHPE